MSDMLEHELSDAECTRVCLDTRKHLPMCSDLAGVKF